MTVIAYTNGEMAADSSCMAECTHVIGTRKIWRVGRGLVGCAGDVTAMLKFLKWLKLGADDDEFPKKCGEFHAMVVDPRGTIKLFENNGPEFCTTNDKYCAIGSGCDFALGALFAGATARDAVRSAIKHSSTCKPPVRIYKLG